MKFGEFARLKRVEAGLTQQQCASALGYTHRANYLKKERGILEWSLQNLIDFAELLGKKPSELLAEYEVK